MEQHKSKRRQHYLGHRKRLRTCLADALEKLQDYKILKLLLGYEPKIRYT